MNPPPPSPFLAPLTLHFLQASPPPTPYHFPAPLTLHPCAGVVFMVGANFILLGSTKVVAILSIYADLLVGLPSRLLGKLLSAAEDQVGPGVEQGGEGV